MHTNPGNVQIKFAASIGRSDFFEPVRAAKCGDNKNMLATQIAVRGGLFSPNYIIQMTKLLFIALIRRAKRAEF